MMFVGSFDVRQSSRASQHITTANILNEIRSRGSGLAVHVKYH